MDWIPVVFLILGVPIALAVWLWLIVRAVNANSRIEELTRRLYELESEIFRLKQDKESRPKSESFSAPVPTPPAPLLQPKIIPSAPLLTPEPIIIPPLPPPVVAPPPVFAQTALPPKPASAPPHKIEPAINWEQFMGVKLFAWLGGLALFLGVAFFIKYSFDNNLVSPGLRVALGFVTGLGLLAGGLLMSRKNYSALSQTLCATGVVILYAVTYACYALYHFALFGPLATFLLMAIITTTAFFLAVRLNALVVAILGMLGGFLTPILLSTGQDNPIGLFGYIAVLDAGLIVVALHRRWYFLTALAAIGTAVMQTGWLEKFFAAGNYFAGDKIFIALGVLLGFNALYLAANILVREAPGAIELVARRGNLALAVVALLFTAWFLTFPPLAQRPWLMFSFVFLIDLAVAALAWLDDDVANAQPVFGLAVFGLLTEWTMNSLTNGMLNVALAFYLIFAVFHSALPAMLQRRRGDAPGLTAQLNHFFPPLALLLVLVPIFKLEELSFLVWPFVLLVDLLAIVLAVLTATLLPVLAVLLLTLAATGALIFKIPADLTGLPASFFLLGAFAVFFVIATVWLARKFKPDVFKSGLNIAGDINAGETLAALLPASSVLLPFLLLIMATLRLPLANPSPVFGLALLLVVLLLGLAKIFSFEWMPLVGLISVFAVECAWHFNRFDPANPI